MQRLKFLAHIQTGLAKGKDHAERETIEVPYLRVANVQDGYLALDDMATMEVPAVDLPRYLLRPGDVLMNEGGDFDKLGRGHGVKRHRRVGVARAHVAHLLGRQAKAMVVAGSRAAAVKYHLALLRYCALHGYDDMHSMVAFSGEVSNKDVADEQHPPEHDFNETNLNPGLRGREMRKAFDTTEYQVMIVANKFQTGFDQPKLVAMYLDKKVSGVEAVQTLSRLNRVYAGKDKTYVIDFANEPKEIEAAFKTFYRDAQVSGIQDANVVYDLKAKLDAMLLYETSEVQQFAAAIVDSQVTHQKLYSLTQAPTDRFNGRLKQLTDAIGHWEAAWRRAKQGGDKLAMGQADAQRSELTTERDALIVFREGLGKFVRLLQKRLNGVPTEQVDLGDLTLTHYKLARHRHGDGAGAKQPQRPGDEESRRTFLEVVYELLTSEKSASLIQATRNRETP